MDSAGIFFLTIPDAASVPPATADLCKGAIAANRRRADAPSVPGGLDWKRKATGCQPHSVRGLISAKVNA